MHYKLDKLTIMIGNLISNEKSIKNSKNQFADEKGNLCNSKNPFYLESIKYQEKLNKNIKNEGLRRI